MKKALVVLMALAMSIHSLAYAADKKPAKGKAVATPFELKDARLGDAADKIDLAFNTQCQSSNDKTCMIMFLPGVESTNSIPEDKRLFAGNVVTTYIFGMNAEKKIEFMQVRFVSEGFDEALKALQSKYGPGKVDTVAVQNRAGASFQNTKALWQRNDEGIVLERFTGNLNTSSVSLIARKAGEESAKENDEKRRKPGNI